MTAQSETLPVRRKRKKARPAGSPAAQPQEQAPATVKEPRIPAGWRAIAAKEFTDEITSLRFLILTIVLTLAGAAAVYSTAGGLEGVASEVSGQPSLFLVLFTAQVGQIPPFTTFITFLGPLLGIVPSAEDVLRLMTWTILTVAYIGFWLALALLCSVLFRRAATSALVALSIWLVLTVFMGLIVGVLAGVLRPVPPDAGTGSPESLANTSMQIQLRRIAPNQLYEEATAVVLDPRLRTVTPDLVTPAQRSGAVGGLLSIDQSLLVVWPQFVALIALTAGVFAVAYVSFMRQEVRA